MACAVWLYLRRVETAPFGVACGFVWIWQVFVRIYEGIGKLYKFRA